MRKNRFSRCARASAALAAGAFVLSSVPAVAAPPAIPPGPPVDASGEQEFGAGELCAFPVLLEFVGKSKLIGDPEGNHKVTSPGFKVTTTNLATGESVKYTATGSTRYTVAVNEDGEYYEAVSTGQNLLFSPELGGLFFVRGTVNFAVDLNKSEEVRAFATEETLDEFNSVNICDPLS